MKVAFFQSHCSECNYEFAYPSLGDFAYGEFIARGEKGNVFAYLNALEESALSIIENYINVLEAGQGNKSREYFQYIVGRCIDKIDGQSLSILGGPVCPKCFSENIYSLEKQAIYSKEIPNVTFNEFLKLKDDERVSYIAESLSEAYLICTKSNYNSL